MKGIYTALVTPFHDDGKVDLNAYKKLLQIQIKAQVNGVVFCGSTGESPTLTLEEKKELILLTLNELKNTPLKVIIGTGSNSTQASIDFSQWADQQGVHGVLLPNPYYNKPSQEGLKAHFKAIADAIQCEVIVYNTSRSVVLLTASSIAELAKHPRIRTIKEADGKIAFISEIRAELEKHNVTMDIVTGDDPTFLAALSAGAVGNISVASNIIPEVMLNIQKLYETGNVKEALKTFQYYYPFFRDLFIEPNPVPAKFALSKIHHFSEQVRLPLTPLTDESRIKMMSTLKNCQMLRDSL